MQEISAYELIKQKLHAIPNQRHKGSLFEKISKQFLQEHDSANEYESIDLWYDWKLRGKERDKGIDIVIQTTSKEYIAVQCKFHQNSISYNDISPFLTQLLIGVGGVKFKKGIIISTSNLTSEALKAIEQIRSTGMGIDLNLFRRHYQDNAIVEEEIFYYIYAIFHHKGYLEKYKNSLAKEAPRIALSEDFKELSVLGKELAELHLNYESGEMHESVKHNLLENAGMEGYYDVVKMTKKGDSIIYNHHITITKIPKKAFDYVVNGKSAIDWVIERYSITTDKDSLIENNPNDYAGGKYVFELLCRVITLSVKSVDLIEKISEKRFE